MTKAFCLHSRPYRETSIIAQLLTEDYGRFSVVAKGVKKGKKNNERQSLLQAFTPVDINVVGKGDLKTLSTIEACGPPLSLKGRHLLAWLYIKE